MPRANNKDFFEQAKGFMVSFNQVLTEGFFQDFSVKVTGYAGVGSTNVYISATGFLPNSKKYMEAGAGALTDPAKAIETIRKELRRGKCVIQKSRCEVHMKDWYLHKTTEGEQKIAGKKGLEVELELVIYLEPKSWPEEDN